MRILGIDPGLRRTGFGVIDVASGSKISYVASGTIIVDTKLTLDLRLKEIADNIQDIVFNYKPDVAVIEKVFVNNNPQSTLLLGHARGAAMTMLALLTLPVSEYTALQIKKAVVGQGHADKYQVQKMVQYLLNLDAAPGSDSADALACAICHAHAAPLSRQVRKQQGQDILTFKSRLRNGRVIG